MTCRKCNGKSVVLDSREHQDGTIRRRRECLECKCRWTTHEREVTHGDSKGV